MLCGVILTAMYVVPPCNVLMLQHAVYARFKMGYVL